VRAADTVPKATRGWDNAKKVNGRKRHIAVDTSGLLLAVVITAASVQDRDYEHLPASHEAMITWAMIALMTRRLTQPGE
jgi:hypothetical protein